MLLTKQPSHERSVSQADKSSSLASNNMEADGALPVSSRGTSISQGGRGGDDAETPSGGHFPLKSRDDVYCNGRN